MKRILIGVPLYYFSIAALALTIALLAFAVYAWSPAPPNPPSNNVAPPINTSATGQEKAGDFSILGKVSVGAHTGDQVLNVNGNIHMYSGATSLGYVYSDGSNFGLLNNLGQWALYIPNNATNVVVPNDIYLGVKSNWLSILLNNSSRWTTSGSSIYYNGGNVGIGTMSPGSPLTISNGSGSSATVQINANASNSYVGLSVGNNASIGGTLGVSGVTTLSNTVNFPGSGIWNSSGNVGVGTASPAGKLDVNGTLCISGDCRSSWPSTSLPSNNTLWDTWYGSAYLGSNGDYYMGWDGRWLSQTINQDVRNGSNPTFSDAYLNSKGNWLSSILNNKIDFNTWGPGSTYYGTNGDIYMPWVGNWLSNVMCRSDGSNCGGNLTHWDTWYGSAYLGSNGDYYMGWDGRWLSETINQDVRSGADPTFNGLNVSGGSWLNYTSNGDWQGIHVNNSNVGSNTVGMLQNNDGSFHIHRWNQGDILYSNSAGTVTALNVGNVGIGTASPGYTLEVNGSVGANSFYYRSDERLKTNIAPIADALSKVLALNGVTFNWKDPKMGTSTQVGFIAQDVEKVLPEVVTTNASTTLKAVDYARVAPVLINAIKEQQKEIDDLKAAVKALQAKQ